MSMKPHCHHGVKWDDECVDCEIEWQKDSIMRATEQLDRATRKLHKLQADKRRKLRRGRVCPPGCPCETNPRYHFPGLSYEARTEAERRRKSCHRSK